MARPSQWPDKVLALLRCGNASAAIAQIKVAPSLRELQALQKALQAPALAGKWPQVEQAVRENLALLAAPRLHRAP